MKKSQTMPKNTRANKSPSDRLRPGLLAVTVAVVVTRTIVVNESAIFGDGLLLVMILLGVGLAWAIDQLRRGDMQIRFSAVDGAVLLLAGLYVLSGCVAMPSGNARAILNMSWQWVGLVAGYFLLRQLIDRTIEARAIVAIMIAMSAALATHGLYQYCRDFPQMRAEYARDGDAMLRSVGMWYPPGSPERIQFENRLNSSEPLATFALTNSLAGFLAPWLIITAGLLFQSNRKRKNISNDLEPIRKPHEALSFKPKLGRQSLFWIRFSDRFLAVVDMAPDRQDMGPRVSDRLNLAWILLLVGVCFMLTKSRTAWAAVALGLFGLGLGLFLKRHTQKSRNWVIGGVAVVLLFVTGLVIVGGKVDSPIVAEAGKSLKYRFEYWQATTRMIATEPWFGTGPGGFQDAYSQYKLPAASEEPADPHNFLFEIAATAGIPALAAMIAVLVCFVARLVLGHRLAVGPRPTCFDATKHAERGSVAKPSVQTFLYLGALLGYLASLPIAAMGTLTPDPFIYWGSLPVGVAALFGLNRWVRCGVLPLGLIGIAWGVLLVNLLAAGGISFPGVAASFWVLLALGMGAGEPKDEDSLESSKSDRRMSRAAGYLVVFGTLGLLVAFYFTAYRPVLAAQAEINAIYREPDQAEAHLRRAAAIDPWSIEPWTQLANLTYQQWEADPTPERFDEFLSAYQEILDRVPRKAVTWFVFAERNQEAYRQMRRPADEQRALAAYGTAVELYPNRSLYRAQWALALALAGNEADSRREAKKSLELDRQNPHLDKRLPDSVKQRLEKLVE